MSTHIIESKENKIHLDKQQVEIREQQKATWNKFSPGWKKWDELTMEFLKPFGDEIIQQLHLKDADVVLDVAAGTGEPGLTIASIVKNGKVMITDLADDMLVVAHENAERKGIKNVEFNACLVLAAEYHGHVAFLPFERAGRRLDRQRKAHVPQATLQDRFCRQLAAEKHPHFHRHGSSPRCRITLASRHPRICNQSL